MNINANAPILRFNAIAPVLKGSYGCVLQTRLAALFAALLRGLGAPCCNLVAIAAAGVGFRVPFRLPEAKPRGDYGEGQP